MSLVMRKPDFCICENKGADQLCGNCTTDQCLCFSYTDCTSPYFLSLKFQASSYLLWVYSLVCFEAWSETPKTGFLTTRLKSYLILRLLNFFLYSTQLSMKYKLCMNIEIAKIAMHEGVNVQKNIFDKLTAF